MNPDIEPLLLDIKKKVDENNRLLKKIYADRRRAMIFGVIKTIIYIGVLVGVYSFLQPFINQMIALYTSIQDSANTLGEIKASAEGFNFDSFKELFK